MTKGLLVLFHYVFYYSYKFLFSRRFKKNQLARYHNVCESEYSLVGFEKRRCIFIHVPKAAGVFLSVNLFGNLGGGHRSIFYYYKIYSPKEIQEYYKFVVVRNPWDRLVSAYHFLKEGGFNDGDKDWFEGNLECFDSFENFVLEWVNLKNIDSFIHFKPQYRYVFFKDLLCVDKVYKFEDMSEVIIDLNSKFGLSMQNTPKNTTKARKADYRSHYSKETQQIVADVYKKDIDLFGYEFGVRVCGVS